MLASRQKSDQRTSITRLDPNLTSGTLQLQDGRKSAKTPQVGKTTEQRDEKILEIQDVDLGVSSMTTRFHRAPGQVCTVYTLQTSGRASRKALGFPLTTTTTTYHRRWDVESSRRHPILRPQLRMYRGVELSPPTLISGRNPLTPTPATPREKSATPSCGQHVVVVGTHDQNNPRAQSRDIVL